MSRKTAFDGLSTIFAGVTPLSTGARSADPKGLSPFSGKSRTVDPAQFQKKNMAETKFSMHEQKFVKMDTTRTKISSLCSRCGVIVSAMNMDVIPSPRVAMTSRCVDGKDFTHHKFTQLSEADRRKLASMSARERISWCQEKTDEDYYR